MKNLTIFFAALSLIVFSACSSTQAPADASNSSSTNEEQSSSAAATAEPEPTEQPIDLLTEVNTALENLMNFDTIEYTDYFVQTTGEEYASHYLFSSEPEMGYFAMVDDMDYQEITIQDQDVNLYIMDGVASVADYELSSNFDAFAGLQNNLKAPYTDELVEEVTKEGDVYTINMSEVFFENKRTEMINYYTDIIAESPESEDFFKPSFDSYKTRVFVSTQITVTVINDVITLITMTEKYQDVGESGEMIDKQKDYSYEILRFNDANIEGEILEIYENTK